MKSHSLQQLKTIIFYIGFSIEILLVILDKSAYTFSFEGRAFQITMGLWLLCILMTKYTLREYVVLAFLGILGLSVELTGDRNEIFRLVLFFAASQDMDREKTLKYLFYTITVGILAIIGLSVVGIGGDLLLTRNFGRVGIETRYCFGMGHPNSFHCMIWAVSALGMYLYREKMKWFHYIGVMVLYALTYYFSRSKTGLLIGIATVFFFGLGYVLPKIKEKAITYYVALVCYLSCIAFSVYVAIEGNYKYVIFQLNRKLTGRLFWGYALGGARHWSLWATPDNNHYFDMGYIRIFYWYGIVVGIVMLLVPAAMFLCFSKTKEYAAAALLLSFACYTVIEAHVVSVYLARNFALLLLIGSWSILFGLHKGKQVYPLRIYNLLKKDTVYENRK